MAYKNLVGEKRVSLQVLSTIQKAESDASSLQLIEECRADVGQVLIELCEEVRELVESVLLPRCTSHEGRAFWDKREVIPRGEGFSALVERAAQPKEIYAVAGH